MTSCLAYADPCSEKLDIEAWSAKYGQGLRVRNQLLADIRTCVAMMPQTRAAFNDLAVQGIGIASLLNDAPAEQREHFLRFNADLLWVLADSGFPSSQDNLAFLHNARPGSLQQAAIRQDPQIFIYWTRHAAAQGNPRALFSLATRMARGVPEMGIVQDQPLAYRLLLEVEKINQANGQTSALGSVVQQQKQPLQQALGPEKTVLLESEPLNLDSLKPKEPLDTTAWDHEANVRESVRRFYKLRMTQGDDASWTMVQKCYASVLGLRRESAEHEACVASDIAATQLAFGLSQSNGQGDRRQLASRYEKAVAIPRLAAAFMQAGMTSSQAAERLMNVTTLVAKATADISDIFPQDKK